MRVSYALDWPIAVYSLIDCRQAYDKNLIFESQEHRIAKPFAATIIFVVAAFFPGQSYAPTIIFVEAAFLPHFIRDISGLLELLLGFYILLLAFIYYWAFHLRNDQIWAVQILHQRQTGNHFSH